MVCDLSLSVTPWRICTVVYNDPMLCKTVHCFRYLLHHNPKLRHAYRGTVELNRYPSGLAEA